MTNVTLTISAGAASEISAALAAALPAEPPVEPEPAPDLTALIARVDALEARKFGTAKHQQEAKKSSIWWRLPGRSAQPPT
jgi:hypothetical protein